MVWAGKRQMGDCSGAVVAPNQSNVCAGEAIARAEGMELSKIGLPRELGCAQPLGEGPAAISHTST